MIVNCNTCNKKINRLPSQIKKSKSGKVYCSRSCSAKANNAGVQRNPPKIRICYRCGEEFTRSSSQNYSTICSKCNQEQIDIKELTLEEYQERLSVKGKHASWKNAYIRNFARSWNKELKSQSCQNCGYSKHVEFCHIKPITSFDKTTKLSVVNSPDNILILCRNCHWEFDNGELKLEEIK